MKQTLKNNQLLAPFASSTARAAANLRLTITKIPSWTCCSTSITMVNCLNHKICHRHGIALAKIPTPKHPASDCGWANAKIVATSGRSRSNNCSSAISDSLCIAPCSKKKDTPSFLLLFNLKFTGALTKHEPQKPQFQARESDSWTATIGLSDRINKGRKNKKKLSKLRKLNVGVPEEYREGLDSLQTSNVNYLLWKLERGPSQLRSYFLKISSSDTSWKTISTFSGV